MPSASLQNSPAKGVDVPSPPSPPPPPPLAPTLPTVSKPASPAPHTTLQGKVIKEPEPGYSKIWLCCYRSYLYMGHWAIFVPRKANDGCGTVINVQGDVKEGFKHEFERLSDPPWMSAPGPIRFHLGNIKYSWISPEATYSPDETTVDTTPANDLEKLALEVPAPGPSLNSAHGPIVSLLQSS